VKGRVGEWESGRVGEWENQRHRDLGRETKELLSCPEIGLQKT
jgi:hypothetical protein